MNYAYYALTLEDKKILCTLLTYRGLVRRPDLTGGAENERFYLIRCNTFL
jgi:hypothetical protein